MDEILKQNIIKDLGLDTLSEDKQEEAVLRIGKIIFQKVLIRVMQELDEKEKDEFEKILKENPDDEKVVLDFLKSKVSNLDEIVGQEVADFKQEVSGFMKEVKE